MDSVLIDEYTMNEFTINATNAVLEEQQSLLNNEHSSEMLETDNTMTTSPSDTHHNNEGYQPPTLPVQDPEIQNNTTTFEDDITDQITELTNRLRIIFYTLTVPILPLTVLLAVCLGQFVATTFNSPDCSHPLKSFAIISVIFMIYAPNHKRIRRFLFNYTDRQQTRPQSVRIYDQMFHMTCFMYFYYGMALMQTCRDDIDPTSGESTCTTTCPQVYQSFQRYSFVINLFVIVLLLPLVCLPFVYLWIIRRIHTDDAWIRLNRDMRRGSQRDDDLGRGITVKELMEGLRSVYLIRVHSDSNEKVDSGSKRDVYYYGSTENDHDSHEKVRIVGVEKESWSGNDTLRDREAVKDCCICMNEYQILDESQALNKEVLKHKLDSQEVIVETKCQHLFHKACLGGWVGGVDWEDATLQSHRRARRRLCPLCRKDLATDASEEV
jgi:hypothetical protein